MHFAHFMAGISCVGVPLGLNNSFHYCAWKLVYLNYYNTSVILILIILHLQLERVDRECILGESVIRYEFAPRCVKSPW